MGLRKTVLLLLLIEVGLIGTHRGQSQPATGLEANCVPALEGLTGWWPGDGTSDDIVASRNGILVGASFSPGFVGQAFSFNGTNSYVRLPMAAGSLSAPLSLEAWVWLNRADRTRRVLTISPERAVLAYSSGAFTFFVGRGPTNSRQFDVIAASSMVEARRWYHIVAAYDGRQQQLFIDGELAASAEIRPDFPFVEPATAPELVISSAGIQALDGLVDEVAIYHRALTAREVQSHFAAGRAGICKVPRFTTLDAYFSGTVRLGIKGPPRKLLEVQSSTDMQGWALLSAVTNFSGNAHVFDPAAGTFRQRFYRAISR